MRIFFSFFLLFLAITGAVSLLGDFSKIEFGNENFWDNHGIFFLFFITVFPRLTLLLSSVASGGVLWWLSWLFMPRFLVAALATVAYWNENPILVMISWFIALSGESSEKTVLFRRPRMRVYSYNTKKRKREYAQKAQQSGLNDPNVFEAEFKEEK